MHQILLTIIEESIRAAGALLTLLLGRWLYALSNPRRDIAWLFSTRVFNVPMRYYRGLELYHQLRGLRLLASL